MKVDNPITEAQIVVIIDICVQCDVEYIGIQRIPQTLIDKGVLEQVLFNDKTGSTRSIPISEFSIETVKERVEEAMKLWQKKYRVVVTKTVGIEYELDALNEEDAIDKLSETEPVKEKELEWDYELEIIDD